MKLAPDYKTRPTARKHRIKILRVETVNESGFVSVKEVIRGEYWASVIPLSERLKTQYQTISVAATHTITVGGDVEVREKDVVDFKGRRFDVLTIKDPDENGRDKLIITQELRPEPKP
jgi:SPP1 family predicted phage head-tail adaptor